MLATSSLAPVPTSLPSQLTMARVSDSVLLVPRQDLASPYTPCRCAPPHSRVSTRLSSLPSTSTMVSRRLTLTLQWMLSSASPRASLVLGYHRHRHRMGLAWYPRIFSTSTCSSPHQAHLCAQNARSHNNNNSIYSRADHFPSLLQNIVSFQLHWHRH